MAGADRWHSGGGGPGEAGAGQRACGAHGAATFGNEGQVRLDFMILQEAVKSPKYKIVTTNSIF